MKKLFIYAGLACAAAFSLSNCSKIDPQTPSSEGMPFEIVASTAETKTANNGFKTTWAGGDALNLFHAETNSTEYGTNDQFTIVSGENFSGTLTEPLEAGKSYDWYALYPYNEKITTLAATEGGFTYVGDSRGVIQNGYNSTEHLSGDRCPLYGVAKNVAADESVKVNMHHLTSVVKVVVTNGNETPLTVTSIVLTAPENIVGSYFIDFTGETVKYTERSSDQVYKTATLNVSGGTALAKDESAAFYIPIKPFKAAANTLKLAVNGHEKRPEATKEVEFRAGHIETVNFKYDNASSSKQVVYYPVNFSGGKVGGGETVTVTNSDSNIKLTATGYAKGIEENVLWLYSGDSFSVTAQNGITITGIEFDVQRNHSGTWKVAEGAGSVSYNATYGTATWKGSQTETVTLKNTGKQARINKITVIYE